MNWQETQALAEIHKKFGARKQHLGTLRAKYDKDILNILIANNYLTATSAHIFLSEEGLLAGQEAERTVAVLTVFCAKILGLTARETASHLPVLAADLTPQILEKYCALIGHAYEHNITAGVCCKQAKAFNSETTLSLRHLPLNTPATVVYIQTALQPALLKLYELGIYPGQTIRIQRLYPAYILATEQGSIALDNALAKFIFVQKT